VTVNIITGGIGEGSRARGAVRKGHLSAF